MNFLVIVLLNLCLLGWGVSGIACDVFPVNNDSVVIGDKMFYNIDAANSAHLYSSDYLGHTISAQDKTGKETHLLSPMSKIHKDNNIVTTYKIENIEMKTSEMVSLKKSKGTSCGWKNHSNVVEKQLDKENWKGEMEVLSLSYDENQKLLIVDVKETCEKGNYNLVFLDAEKKEGREILYYKVTRQSSVVGICKSDFSEVVRIRTEIDREILKVNSKVIVLGSEGTSGSVLISRDFKINKK